MRNDRRMVPELEQATIRCPVCNMKTVDRICPGCGEDLTLLHEYEGLAVANYNLGLYLAQQHKKESIEHAKECLRLAIALRVDFVEPYIVLGKLLIKQRQYPEAVTYWNKALSIDSQNKEAKACLNSLRELFGGDADLRLEANWHGKPIRLGCNIKFADGHKGTVWRIMPAGKTHEFTHIIVWRDTLFRSTFPRDLIVPVELISDVKGNVIFIGKQQRELRSHISRYNRDSEITSKISDVLLTYEPIRALQGMVITVSVTNGKVTLFGNVPSLVIKQKAEEIAITVNGVLAVRNSLTCDTDLELAVGHTLARNPQTNGKRIFVRSSLGVVSLEGRVDSTQARDSIEKMVSGVNGVKGVISRLTVVRASTVAENNQEKS